MITEPDANPAPPDSDPPEFDLRLFVAGQSSRSVRAVENLRRVCDEHLAGPYRVLVGLQVRPHGENPS